MTGSLLLFIAGALFPTVDVSSSAGAESLRCRVEFALDLGCESEGGEGAVSGIVVKASLPRDLDRQKVADLRFDPPADALLDDAHGNRFAVWRVGQLAPGATKRLSWSCVATTSAVAHDVDRSKLRPIEETPAEIRARYLKGGTKYRLKDPKLVEAAQSIRTKAGDALDLAFKTNEFIRSHLVYKNDGTWDDAPGTLANGHGSCSEYNFLFLSLCRLNGLAARHVGATARRSDSPDYVDTVHHRWSEVYLPGHGWFPIDVSRNDGEDGAPVNQYFGKTPDGLLVLVKGDGGDGEPLGWGYVYDVDSHKEGKAVLTRAKRFTWTKLDLPKAEAAGSPSAGSAR